MVRLDDPSSVDSARAYLKRSAAASLKEKEKQEEEGGRVDRQALELRVQALLQTYASVDSQPPRIILSTVLL